MDKLLLALAERMGAGFYPVQLPNKKRKNEDGGDGSGNWGHEGVPGQVGGSAPGGGTAYRSGTKETGFTGTGKSNSLQDLPRYPKRPRRSEYDLSTDEGYAQYEKDRDKYRAAKATLTAKVERVTQAWKEKPRQFTSKEQVAEWSKQSGVNIDSDLLDRMDPLLFDDVVGVQAEMFERYPQVKAYQDSFLTWGNRFSETDDGFMDAGAGINFSKSFTNADRVYSEVASSQLSGYTTAGDGTLRTLIRHEFGHHVDDYCRSKFTTLDDTYEDHISGRTEQKMQQRRQYESELVSLTKTHGSEYSMTNTAEAFAEGFAEYSSNPNSEYGRAFGEFLGRWLN